MMNEQLQSAYVLEDGEDIPWERQRSLVMPYIVVKGSEGISCKKGNRTSWSV